MADALPAFKRLLEVFNRLGISYAVGGSLASSVHGIPRATIDIDIIVDPQQQQIEPFARKLEADFYADPVVIQDCIDAGRSFNLIHYQSGYKFVLFPLSPDPYYQVEFARRQMIDFPLGDERLNFLVVAPEDAILTKLAWYRAGGETSGRHWNDLLGIFKIHAGRLDEAYLKKWAAHLSVEDLWTQLLET